MSIFEDITPDFVIDAVEDAIGKPFTGFASSLPSYINRVYELEAKDKSRYIAKVYRPDRWSKDALEDEHEFVLDCHDEEIPVIAPLELQNGSTLGDVDDIYFAVYPKRWGRELEANTEEDWIRLGQLLGRIHLVGTERTASARLKLHPDYSLKQDIDFLLKGNHISRQYVEQFEEVAMAIYQYAHDLDFDDTDCFRIHGDCHRANILDRPDEGLMVIDFDDMMMGPPVQDMWLLLPGHIQDSRHELNLIIEGYEQFMVFDYRTTAFVEPLRAMRIIYFLAWCAKQKDDFKFQHHFPNWGTDIFWNREIADLNHQLNIMTHQPPPSGNY